MSEQTTKKLFLGFDLDQNGELEEYELSDSDMEQEKNIWGFFVELEVPIPTKRTYKVTITEEGK